MVNKTALLNEYKVSKSIKSASRQAGISEGKARKILITEGVLHYDRTDKLLELLNNGATLEQASEQLGISPKVANNYLPYDKGEYNSDTPTINALRIKKCRENKH